MASSADNSKAPPTTYVQKLLLAKRNKTMSESSESSETDGSGSGTDLATNSRLTNPMPKPVPGSKEHYMYDKYLANFFNPLHSKPNGEGIAPETRTKDRGVLYDLDGKFAYSTYSEEMRSYHPMLDIKTLTKDLK
jgi:hypothetical protein